MSGKKLVLLMAAGILVTSTIMYTLYFLTRQLDYISPSEAPVEPAAPHVRIVVEPHDPYMDIVYTPAT